jgi:hypothetical protein
MIGQQDRSSPPQRRVVATSAAIGFEIQRSTGTEQKVPVDTDAVFQVGCEAPVEINPVFRPEYIKALSLLSKVCDEVVARGYQRPVLVGGAAVEFHTGGAVGTGDFDLVMDRHEVFEDVLPRFGFIEQPERPDRRMRWFRHPALGMGVEVVSDHLYDGKNEAHRIRLIEFPDGGGVLVVPVEDLIADRLRQYDEDPSRRSMLDQAIKMYQLAPGIDRGYLDKRIRTYTNGAFALAFLEERA